MATLLEVWWNEKRPRPGKLLGTRGQLMAGLGTSSSPHRSYGRLVQPGSLCGRGSECRKGSRAGKDVPCGHLEAKTGKLTFIKVFRWPLVGQEVFGGRAYTPIYIFQTSEWTVEGTGES